jgi:hypothetical protein
LYEMARTNPEWFSSKLTVAQTRRDAGGEDGGPVISESIVDRERFEGMPENLIEQEILLLLRGSGLGGCLRSRDGRCFWFAGLAARTREDGGWL